MRQGSTYSNHYSPLIVLFKDQSTERAVFVLRENLQCSNLWQRSDEAAVLFSAVLCECLVPTQTEYKPVLPTLLRQ